MIRRASLLSLAVCFVLLGVVGSARAGSPVHIREVQPKGYPKMETTVSVDGPVAPNGITVTENGRRAQVLSVETLSQTGRRFDVILALDTSNSVRGEPLAAAVAAARDFVARLAPGIPLGLVTFADHPRVLQGISADHASSLEALTGINQTQLGTALFDSVVSASELFAGDAQHNIVLLTDGADVDSRADLNAAIQAARAKKVAIYTIGFGGKTNSSVLQALATRTGGTYTPTVQNQLSAVYQALVSQLSHQYVVTYRSVSAPGSQVALTVSTSFGSDSSLILNPASPPAIAPPARVPAFLRGTSGIAIALSLSFVALFLLFTMGFGVATRARRDRELARKMAGPSMSDSLVEQHDAEGDLEGWGGWIPAPLATAGKQLAEVGGFSDAVEHRLEQAGMPVRVGEFVATSVLAGLAAGLLGELIFGSLLFALICAAAGGAISWIYLGFKLNKRVNDLHSQLPDVMMILASSLRAGHSFLQALDTVAKEIGDPTAPEFTRVVAEVRLGRPVDEAMNALAERVGTDEFKWAIMAVNVQREVGGNLAEILDTVAETVRERDTVRRQVKVLSAEGRLSVKILVALPFLMTLYIAKVNPGYIRLLWTTRPGLVMLGLAIALMSIGIYWARKVVKIDV
jgi:tight adherence protein B